VSPVTADAGAATANCPATTAPVARAMVATRAIQRVDILFVFITQTCSF